MKIPANPALTVLAFAAVTVILSACFRYLSKAIKEKKRRYIVLSLFIALLIVLTIAIAVIVFADFMLYHPNHNSTARERNLRRVELTEIELSVNANLKLYGWLRKGEKERGPVVIYYGGNGENSADTVDYFNAVNVWETFEGCSFLMVDYPGYGKSSSRPSNRQIFKMAGAVYDYAAALDFVDEDEIYVLGFSLGTGAATYIASERQVKGLILIAPYDEGRSLYNNFIDVFYGPLEFLVRNKYQSKIYAKKVAVAPLILASRDDEVIPLRLSAALNDAFLSSYFYTFDGIGHNDFWRYEQTHIRIKAYLNYEKE
jgi:pimeloyl-ACP methyl ester carboxylesterase